MPNGSGRNVLAKVGQVFSPFHPIQIREFFAGRIGQIEQMAQAIHAPGQHIVLFGDRGVGKTSLANITPYLTEKKVVFHHCHSEDNFQKIFSHFLREFGHEMVIEELTTDYSDRKQAKVSAGLASGNLEATRGRSARQRPYHPTTIDVGLVLQKLGAEDCVLVIDEYDRIQDRQINRHIADTLKVLSDENKGCKLMIVGVASSVNELIGEHQSISRSLCQIELKRMSKDELEQIIAIGETDLGVTFDAPTKRKIVDLSDGLPFYTQLLAYYTTIGWARRERNTVISNGDLLAGISEAISSAAETLRETYARATKTVKGKTDRFRNVLWACAMPDEIEVHARTIAENVGRLENGDVPLLACSYHLGELTKQGREAIITRVSKGWYRFTNPLMRGFVRLQMVHDDLVYRGGQLLFPFMRH